MSQLLKNIEAERLSEMAMVDIAFEILKETNRPYNFRELMDEISALRGLTNEQMMSIIAQVYTEVNIDGRFVCIGDNTWGLKRWYPTETVEESQEGGKKKKAILDDDFDDYELEEEITEEDEEDDISVFEDDDFADDDDFDDEIEDDEEIIDDEELFEDEDEEELEEEEAEESEEENEDD